MSQRRLAILSVAKLGADQVVVQVGSFARNVILARLIAPDDFGIATILILTFSLVEMVSNVAVETLIVQSDDGGTEAFQNSAHLFQACRGAINAALLLLLSAPVSRLFGLPDAKWAFQAMSALPLIKGLAHTDAVRFKRHWMFGPAVVISISAATIATVATLPIASSIRNYSAVVWILLTQVTVSTVVSHLVAERPYRWQWVASHLSRILTFGWPLLVNGLLMYLIFQGDRLVIALSGQMFGSTFTHATLAAYSVAISCVLMPASFVAEISTSLFLPLLSQGRRGALIFLRMYVLCTQILGLAAVCISVPLILAGEPLIAAVFGHDYRPPRGVMVWLGGMIALRVIRMGPTLAAVAMGDTKNGMVSNTARTAALFAVLGVTAAGYGLEWVAACGFAGELLAMAVCVERLRLVHGIPRAPSLIPDSIACSGIFLAGTVQAFTPTDLSWHVILITSVALISLVAVAMLAHSPRLRIDVLTFAGFDAHPPHINSIASR